MKIHVISTGGTIDSKAVDSTISLGEKSAVIEMFNKKYTNNIEFVSTSPFNILSENITPDNWQLLIAQTDRVIATDCDGIIITHGSDTLSYTSAMMSIAYANTPKVICITGANKVLTEIDSNGLQNFAKCVELISDNKKGIYTVFDDVFLADTIIEADCFADKFARCPYPMQSFSIDKSVTFEKKVLLIKAYPFMDFSTYNPNNYGAVLISGFHSGTVPTFNSNLREFVLKCKKQNIEVYLTSVKSQADKYETLKEAMEYGIKLLYDTTVERAYALLMFKVNAQ